MEERELNWCFVEQIEQLVASGPPNDSSITVLDLITDDNITAENSFYS